MQIKKFQKTKEDFTCENCKHPVKGDGFTNHCPKCLFSKHVDVFPGDRKESCGGLMEVTLVEKKGDGYAITHTCQACKKTSKDHVRPEDDFDALIAIVNKLQKP